MAKHKRWQYGLRTVLAPSVKGHFERFPTLRNRHEDQTRHKMTSDAILLGISCQCGNATGREDLAAKGSSAPHCFAVFPAYTSSMVFLLTRLTMRKAEKHRHKGGVTTECGWHCCLMAGGPPWRLVRLAAEHPPHALRSCPHAACCCMIARCSFEATRWGPASRRIASIRYPPAPCRILTPSRRPCVD